MRNPQYGFMAYTLSDMLKGSTHGRSRGRDVACAALKNSLLRTMRSRLPQKKAADNAAKDKVILPWRFTFLALSYRESPWVGLKG